MCGMRSIVVTKYQGDHDHTRYKPEAEAFSGAIITSLVSINPNPEVMKSSMRSNVMQKKDIKGDAKSLRILHSARVSARGIQDNCSDICPQSINILLVELTGASYAEHRQRRPSLRAGFEHSREHRCEVASTVRVIGTTEDEAF